jgi:drug/metabolite transporter (DMT)-like permease
MADGYDDRSLGDLLAELSRETSTLVRKEMELAQVEMTAKAKQTAIDAGTSAAGGVLAHAGMLVLLAALVMILVAVGVAPWLAALIVAVAAMGIGYVMLNRGMSKLRHRSLVPTQTMESLKEDAKWTTRQRA